MAQGEHPNQGMVAQPTVVSMGAQRKRVNILAMGSSRTDFEVLQLMEQRPDVLEGAETWGINYMGAIKRLDRIIHLDPVHPYLGHSVVKDMCDNALKDNVPFYTSHKHPFYSNHVVYPFDMVVKNLGSHYLNGSVAYAVALAIAEGYTDIGLFGADFSYPNAHVSESGRACVEYWMGVAAGRGVRFIVAQSSTLMDAHCRQQPYGWFKNPLHPPSSGGVLMSVQEIFDHVAAERMPKQTGAVAFHVAAPPAQPTVVAAEHSALAQHPSASVVDLSALRPVAPGQPNGAVHAAGNV